MKDVSDTQRKQKTSYEDSRAKDTMESESMHGVPSVSDVASTEMPGVNSDGILDEILSRYNLLKALKRVEKNKGSHGVDGMQVDELRPFLKQEWTSIRESIKSGKYKPEPVRRVEIPKPDGGKRLLGIPTVLDRLIQQAVAQVLTKVFDPGFSENSFGFRPGRGAHDAVKKAKGYINEGYDYVVDIDLEKFFDNVNHDILMNKISRKICDRRVLRLIRAYLKSGVMLNGVCVSSEFGTPQGGPLSPLLANIMLDELDKELESRGHKFCRYADDCNIYVQSKRAGLRVMNSIKQFIEKRLKLRINESKSDVDRPLRRKFLGFSFFKHKGESHVRIHQKSIARLKDKVRKITSRSYSISIERRIQRLNQITIGWVNYFSIATAKSAIQRMEEWIRRRLRMCIWKQWKKTKTKIRNLIKLGIPKAKAYEWGNTRKGYWHIANSPILSRTLTNQYFKSISYQSLSARYQKMQET